MKNMLSAVTVVVALCFVSDSLPAQDASYDEVRANLERLESAMQIVLRYSPRKEDGIIELVEGQKAQLELLGEEYQRMIDEIQSLGDGPDTQKAKMALFATKMSSLSSKLHNDILLPVQSDALDSLVFTRFLKHRGGSLLGVIEKYYRKQFGLSNEQREKLEAIESDTAEKVAEAKERFKKELQKINEEARNEVKTVLTPRQNKLLDKFHSR